MGSSWVLLGVSWDHFGAPDRPTWAAPLWPLRSGPPPCVSPSPLIHAAGERDPLAAGGRISFLLPEAKPSSRSSSPRQNPDLHPPPLGKTLIALLLAWIRIRGNLRGFSRRGGAAGGPGHLRPGPGFEGCESRDVSGWSRDIWGWYRDGGFGWGRAEKIPEAGGGRGGEERAGATESAKGK